MADSERIRGEQAINHVSSLSDIVYASLIKFLELVSHQQSSSGVHIPFKYVLKEYNERVERLIEMLSLDEYRKMSWPVPELVKESDEENNSTHWTLKYWNTDECFDQVIRRQFYQLISLDELPRFDFGT